MPRPLHLLDSILVVLAARLLAASYARFGFAPIATQFMLVLAFNFVSGVAGCYLVSRWTIPDTLTGILMIGGAANVLWITSSSTPYRRVWNDHMYRDTAMRARLRYQDRRIFRIVSLASAILCTLGASATLYAGQVTGAVVFAGLGAISWANSATGYLQAAPPPEPNNAG